MECSSGGDVLAAGGRAMAKTESDVRAVGSAQTPRGVNHIVLNVRDIEVSHRFWTEIVGFRCVAELKPQPGKVRPKMRFYSGVSDNGDLSHHDVALAEVPRKEGAAAADGAPETWSLMGPKVGLNHVAIAWPDRESWLKQLEFLQSQGRHVPPAHQPRHDPQRVHLGPGRPRDRGPLRAAPRRVGRRHRRGPELRRGAADRRARVARRPHRQPPVWGQVFNYDISQA